MKNFTSLLRRTRPEAREKSRHRTVGFLSFLSFVAAMLSAYGSGATIAGPTYCVPHPSYASLSCTGGYAMYLGHIGISGSGVSFDDYTGCDGTGYEDRTTAVAPINLTPGGAYTMAVYNWSDGIGYSFSGQIWIDFNDDGVFSASETVGGLYVGEGTYPELDMPFSIPSAGVSGLHRMRIRSTNTDATYPDMGACDDNMFGEAQDYMVQIGPGCSLAATMTVTNNTCPGGTNGAATVSATGTGTLSYTWLHDGSHGTSVSGLAAGAYVVAITNDTCTIYDTAVVTSPDGAIHGATLSVGTSATFTDAVPGGVWSSLNTSIATVDSNGLVTGVSAGSVGISYFVPSCGYGNVYWTYVSPFLTYCTPSINYGSDNCGYGIYIQDFSVAGESSSGINDYGSGCGYNGYTDRRYASVGTVNFNPGNTYTTYFYVPWGGAGSVQIWIDFNNDGTFSADETVGGVNIFYNYGSATIAIPSGLATGNRTMRVRQANYWDGTYPDLGPCVSYNYGETQDYTVHIGPSVTATIEGYGNVCAGGTTHFSGSPAGGTWSSNNTDVATVDSTGMVTGINGGTATVTYSYSGVIATAVVNVNALPEPISSDATVCAGSFAYMYDPTPGGSWNSTDSSISVDEDGIVTGLTPGTATVTYTTEAGCATSKAITVLAAPQHISGSDYPVCVGSTVTFSDATTGGSWSSSDVTIATVGSTGVVTGASVGSAMISYRVASGCQVTRFLDVIPALSAGTISGASSVVIGSTINLSDSGFYSSVGSWSSSNTRATVDGSGMVTGVSAGTAKISYSVSNSCGTAIATKVITVNAAAAPSGTLTVCSGLTTTLSNSTGGGVWTSGNISIARVDSNTGVVTGAAPGVALISYTTSAGFVTTSVTVLALPNVITGTASLCTGAITTLTSSTGGTWTSMSTDVAAISSTGVVSGLTAGNATISYTNSNGCSRSTVVTVVAQPTITNTVSICPGTTDVLIPSVSGGTWSGGSSVAVVSGGVVTGGNAGTAFITYTMGGICRAVSTVTVNPLPANITGTLKVCPGYVTTLADLTTGGAWSTTATNASVGATTGSVSGISAGTAVVSYTTAAGCSKTAVVTVNAAPATIGGTTTTCVGTTATLTNTSALYSWTSGNTSVATINSASGVYTGVSAGTATITFMAAGTFCTSTAVIAINAVPGAISGTATTCVGNTTALTNAVTGGSWFSNNTSVATVDVAGGIVTGVGAGTATISYMANGCGAMATKVVTVGAAPSAATITGASSVATGATVALSASIAGGSWISNATSIATVGSTGVVNGSSEGVATISYVLTNSCGSTTSTKDITVVAAVAPITGMLNVCTGNTSALSSATTGGTWSSANSAIATIGSATGVVTAIASGVTTVTYTAATGSVTALVTVNPTPVIAGTTAVCLGSAATLSSNITGGTWSSSDPTTASIGLVGDVATSVPGSVNINYVLSTGCAANTTFVVNALPSAITGAGNLCVGSTEALTSLPTGGTWSSSFTSVASVNSAGVATGVGSGATNITYKLSTGCQVSTTLSVSAVPAAISGALTMCEGATTSLANGTTGGVWSSNSPAVATVAASGIVSGVMAGTATIAYTTGSGCASSTVVTVNAAPSISGTTTMCPGGTTVLTASLTGGSWGGGNSTIAIVNSTTGVVSGLAAGSTAISYTMATGCKTGIIVSVNAAPTAFTGTLKACPGTTSTLASTPVGGVWSSADATVSVDPSTGAVMGMSAGTATITYASGLGCVRTGVFTVNATPAAIAGTPSACVGSTTALTNGSGVWSSDNTGVATVSSTGVVTGVSAGNANITFAATGTGCTTSVQATINSVPAAISGAATVCVGSTTALTDGVIGGTWSSSSPALATVGSSTGIVTGIAAGGVYITYATGTGCYKTKALSVNSASGTITGYSTICQGSVTVLSAWGAGTWSSSDATIASIGTPSSGTVTGVNPGTASIIFTPGATGCGVSYTVTVISTPAAITGTTAVCSGQTSALADATPGGVWSSGNTGTATIGTSGVVTAVGSAGTVTITYAFGAYCRATTTFTVRALPAYIGGTATVCNNGVTTTLSDATSGGTWSSSNNSVATVGTGLTAGYGAVTGHTAGTATISYTLSATGCARSVVVTVNPCTRGNNPDMAATTTGLQLYPNPTQGAFTVMSDAAGTMQVYSMEGREVTRFTIGTGINTLNLPADLARGVYMCRYNGNDGNTVTVRLVLE